MGYVDNIIVMSDYHEEIACLKAHLAKEFEIKDLGNMRYFMGIEVARLWHGIYISQQKYTQDRSMLGAAQHLNPSLFK